MRLSEVNLTLFFTGGVGLNTWADSDLSFLRTLAFLPVTFLSLKCNG